MRLTEPRTANNNGAVFAIAVLAIIGIGLVLSQQDLLAQILGGLGMLWLMFAAAVQAPALKAWNARHNTLVSLLLFGPIAVGTAIAAILVALALFRLPPVDAAFRGPTPHHQASHTAGVQRTSIDTCAHDDSTQLQRHLEDGWQIDRMVAYRQYPCQLYILSKRA